MKKQVLELICNDVHWFEGRRQVGWSTVFSPWKARIVLILQENELWNTVDSTTTNPVTVPIDAAAKIVFAKKDIKAKIILLDAIKDHVIKADVDSFKQIILEFQRKQENGAKGEAEGYSDEQGGEHGFLPYQDYTGSR